MKECLILVLCLIVVITIVCGCTMKKPKPDDDNKKVMEPSLTSAVLGRNAELHVHLAEEFVILADGNITTGFSWFYCGKDTVDGVELKKNDYIHPKTNGITSGAPGKSQFVFEAKKVGRHELKFEYKRPWEKDMEPMVKTILIIVE